MHQTALALGRKKMASDIKDQVLSGVQEQIRDLQPGLAKQAEIAAVLAELGRLIELVTNLPLDATVSKLLPSVKTQVEAIQLGKSNLPEFGAVLVDLLTSQQSLE